MREITHDQDTQCQPGRGSQTGGKTARGNQPMSKPQIDLQGRNIGMSKQRTPGPWPSLLIATANAEDKAEVSGLGVENC